MTNYMLHVSPTDVKWYKTIFIDTIVDKKETVSIISVSPIEENDLPDTFMVC